MVVTYWEFFWGEEPQKSRGTCFSMYMEIQTLVANPHLWRMPVLINKVLNGPVDPCPRLRLSEGLVIILRSPTEGPGTVSAYKETSHFQSRIKAWMACYANISFRLLLCSILWAHREVYSLIFIFMYTFIVHRVTWESNVRLAKEKKKEWKKNESLSLGWYVLYLWTFLSKYIAPSLKPIKFLSLCMRGWQGLP